MSEGKSDADPCVQSYVIFDLETTGLPKQDPKITELCFLGVSRSDLLQETSVPRVINKLLIFADPCKHIEPEAAAITGLDNELLFGQKPFDSDLVQLMSIFLDRLPKPVCLVAHNGDRFDYPLLVSELRQANSLFPDDLLCTDTLQAFKELDKLLQADAKSPAGGGDSLDADDKKSQDDKATSSGASLTTKMSYRLEEVYKRCFKEAPRICHTAEDDCLTLLKVVKKYSSEFVEWADKNAKTFRDISPMY